jgi:multidrug transporter EmrE-like cation transporter
MIMRSLIFVLTPVFIGVLGQLALKHGMNQVGKLSVELSLFIPQMMKSFMNPFVFVGFVLYFFSALVWLMVLSRFPLSYAYPMLSVSYVAVVLLSGILFHETVSPVRWLGILIICAGVVVLSRG